MTNLNQSMESNESAAGVNGVAGDGLDFRMSAHTSGPTSIVAGQNGNYKAEFRISVKNTAPSPRKARIVYSGRFSGEAPVFSRTKRYDVNPGQTLTIREAFPVSKAYANPGTFVFSCKASATTTDVAEDSQTIIVRPKS